MTQFALIATLQAKPGKEKETEEFLKSALPMVEAEPDTLSWYAVKFDENRFAIFDSFPSEEGRNAHLTGKVAKALMEKAPDLFVKTPSIARAEVLAVKEGKVKGTAERVV